MCTFGALEGAQRICISRTAINAIGTINRETDPRFKAAARTRLAAMAPRTRALFLVAVSVETWCHAEESVEA